MAGGRGDQNWKHQPGGEPQGLPLWPWLDSAPEVSQGCDKDRGFQKP